jgi:hypothetical protein
MNWNFNKLEQGFDYQGIRDGDIEVFDKTRYQSIVRESIQNSLDAKLDDTKPVTVSFNFFELPKEDHLLLSEIENRIIASRDWDKANDDDKDLIDQMINSFEPKNYTCLEISDFNTKGMDADTTFDSFAHSRNVSTKASASSAGSKGMGKAAYFAASYLRTLVVSSIFHENKNRLFQGISRISTHNIDDVEYNYKGFFSEELRPLNSFHNVPEVFKRDDVGTSIFVIGLWPEKERLELMKKELVNNFWLAILEEELIVTMNGDEINHQNIYRLITELHPDLYESGNYNTAPNPRPYFEAYKGIKCVQKVYPGNIDHLGNVKFVIAKNNYYQGRIANFRLSKMLIWKDPAQLYKGYCGIFICEDPKGNQILKRLENATHTEWKAGNWKDPLGRSAIKAHRDFIKKCIDDFVDDQSGDDLTIDAFDELLNLFSGEKSGKGKNDVGRKKPVITSQPTQGESEYIPKSFNWIRNRTVKKTEGFEYQIVMNSKKNNNRICFEILVGSDDTSKASVNIKSLSMGNFKENRMELKLNKGDNLVSVQLLDNLKHSIRLKEIEAL